MGYSMEFLELWSQQIKKSPSSKWFHGIRRGSFQMIQVFHGIPWNISWNSMELWYRQLWYNLDPWNSMEYIYICVCVFDCLFLSFSIYLRDEWGLKIVIRKRAQIVDLIIFSVPLLQVHSDMFTGLFIRSHKHATVYWESVSAMNLHTLSVS